MAAIIAASGNAGHSLRSIRMKVFPVPSHFHALMSIAAKVTHPGWPIFTLSTKNERIHLFRNRRQSIA